MSITKPKNIVIVGGSLGGLFIGIALKRLQRNLTIRILERNPTPLLQDQGAGVVAGPDVQKFFQTYDRTQTGLSVQSNERLYLDKFGNIKDREERTQQMTSWDLLYHLLRTNYDGVKTDYADAPKPENNEGEVTYEFGNTVTDIEVPVKTNDARLEFDNPVVLTVKDKEGQTGKIEADLVIAADGPSSTVRTKYLPNIKREYAGYVGWRGTIPEDQASEAARKVFIEKFPFFHAEHTQILAYTIPGKNGTLEPGKRLLNWVWYVNYEKDSPEHVEIMTDKDGHRRHVTLPAGAMRDEVWKRQKDIANEILPPQFAELVNKTKVSFIQEITDVIAPSAVLAGGRVVLVGDALAGVRPNTGMSTSQAAKDAMSLAETVGRILDGQGMQVLRQWEKHVVGYAQDLQSRGVEIGNRSQFSKHPMAD